MLPDPRVLRGLLSQSQQHKNSRLNIDFALITSQNAFKFIIKETCILLENITGYIYTYMYHK
ncbi:hypothetical protein Hanom_Chr01g00008711 [Helianthus anomalus]